MNGLVSRRRRDEGRRAGGDQQLFVSDGAAVVKQYVLFIFVYFDGRFPADKRNVVFAVKIILAVFHFFKRRFSAKQIRNERT